METYDFSAFAGGKAFGGSMSGTDSDTNGFGGMGGMSGGTNSFGSGMGSMSSADMASLFEQSPFGGLQEVGITNFEQVFRGNTGGNLQRSDGGSTSGGTNNQGKDSLLAGGDGNTSASGYSYNFSSLP